MPCDHATVPDGDACPNCGYYILQISRKQCVPHYAGQTCEACAHLGPVARGGPFCDHSPPPDSAFAWSAWARCACGEVEYRRDSARVELMTGSHYEGQRATDGTPIDSRRKHEAYMKAHGLAMASDYTQSWASIPQRRAEEDRRFTRELVDTIGRTAHTQRSKR